MRKPIIAGNWKMNKNYDEALEFIKAVADKVPSSDKVETAICAPALYLRSLVEHQGENLR
ncbi:MAG: triose-phosphate isomerase, partial [Turicibacter sp.]|nr:triose-phosphate isomerase [Turicibacter sp.]